MTRAHGMHLDLKHMKSFQKFSKQLQIKSDHVLSQELLKMNKVGSDRNNDFYAQPDTKKVSEHDQEIPHSLTADQSKASRGRGT